MAIGAAPARVVRLVLTRVTILVGIGVLIGAGTSVWASKLVAALLYGVEPRDPVTLIGAALMLAIVVPASLAAANLAELLAVPAAEWGQRLVGTNAIFCLKSIPFLAAAPLVAALLALRQGAPEHPALAGAAAGLFAGAIGAACYATHCPDDSPLFVAAWYSLAIGFVAAIGAAAGRRLLRW